MRIIIFNKKVLYFCILVIFLILCFITFFYHPFCLAYELTVNSTINEELKDRISSITKNKVIILLTTDMIITMPNYMKVQKAL